MLKHYRCSYWNIISDRLWPVFPFCHEEAYVEGERSFAETTADYLICAAILSGDLTYRVEGRMYPLSARMFFLIPPNMRYSFRSSTGYRKLVLEIKGIHLTSILDTIGLVRPLLLSEAEKFNDIIGKIDEIGRQLETHEVQNIPLLMGKTYELLHIFSILTAVSEKSETQLLTKALNLLEANINGAVSIPEIARKLLLSERSLERLIRKAHGLTPKQYRNRCRIEQAKHLLLTTELSIKEIAFQLGYCSQYYFSSNFRHFATVSPQEYRRKHSITTSFPAAYGKNGGD